MCVCLYAYRNVAAAIAVMMEGQFQVSQTVYSCKLVLITVGKPFRGHQLLFKCFLGSNGSLPIVYTVINSNYILKNPNQSYCPV